MFTFKTQPQSIWGVMGDGFQLYGNSIAKIWYWQIIFMLPTFTLTTLINFLWGGPFEQISLTPTLVANLLIVSIISAFSSCFIFNRIHAIATQNDTTIKASMRVALKKTWPILGGALFLLILLAAIYVPIVFLLLDVLQVSFGILLLVGAFAYLLTICLSIFVLLFPFFILFENKGVFQSILLSLTHMWGNFWRTLFMLVAISAISLAALLVIMVPIQIIITLATSSSEALGVILGFILIPTTFLTMYTFFMPLVNAILLTLFYDIKIRKILEPSLIKSQETQ